MKLLTKDQADAHYRRTIQGGVKGFTVGLAGSLGMAYFLNGRWPYFRQLPIQLKALSIVLVTIPATVIQAEHESDLFQREQWQGAAKNELDEEEAQQLQRWEALGWAEKAYDYAARHQFGMVVGGWAVGMVGAGGFIMRDKLMTFPQKIVQIRMWAQGITVVSVVASALIFSSKPREKHVDHSWRDILAEEARIDAIRKQAQEDASTEKKVSLSTPLEKRVVANSPYEPTVSVTQVMKTRLSVENLFKKD
ncbi:hypothetical protein DACRYDRAFT_19551 [Dacryopinax primogenitus]|uniref:HIG1 domain-containing protein n=1 Tax=Dacryopinax primogenitus (strain DJM 731) TaxID=1858805 RepID=M5GBL9_DACPD|nr:uncharacterized protein DACRYDRAFT_19551 [Dacryopinax primogenitus]EJU06369.1 hypothetical protein DACRYDRAFT_19551 [Dacryopinax primogenitus]